MSVNARRLILVVEDDDSIRETLSFTLEAEGFSVVSATDGQHALDLLRQGHFLPSMILLDFNMPNKNGMEFRLEQQADPTISAIPVVMMSAESHPERHEVLRRFEHVLVKPLNVDDLISTIDQFAS